MSLDNFGEDFGLDNEAFEELMADVKADFNRDMANDLAQVSAELKQAQQSIAAYQAREQHFGQVMSKQQAELQRFEGVSATTLQLENFKRENTTLVHHNIQLEADVAALKKSCSM
ncbi:hypothetical protein AAVH_19787 [Aphelenchoides avenae]|nr:hypothetical protein AAVH_19787 [Aphelenchus avenae]